MKKVVILLVMLCTSGAFAADDTPDVVGNTRERKEIADSRFIAIAIQHGLKNPVVSQKSFVGKDPRTGQSHFMKVVMGDDYQIWVDVYTAEVIQKVLSSSVSQATSPQR